MKLERTSSALAAENDTLRLRSELLQADKNDLQAKLNLASGALYNAGLLVSEAPTIVSALRR